jgi:hypothetical protein
MEEAPLKFVWCNATLAWRSPLPETDDCLGPLKMGDPVIVLDEINPDEDFAFVVCRLGVCYVWRTDLE